MKTLANQIADVQTLLTEKKSINRPNAKTKKEIKALESTLLTLNNQLADIPSEIIIDANTDVNTDLLNKLSAMNITDKLKKTSESRSVFKKEFNNKSDRTKCRTKFIGAISMYLLHIAHNKIDLAKKELDVAIELANKYYVAESAFKNYTDYCTENMEQNKKDAIKLFCEMQTV